MSGIAGVVDLGGLPVEPGLLGAMADAVRHRGPDGLKVWHDGPAGLVHSHFWTTPEDVGEAQPISSSDGRYWITADARIDNRDELIPDLRRAGTLRSAVPSDGEVILAAFQTWGDDCAARLVGDFAFAIWDAQSRRLFAARDVIGLRQVCYAITNDRVYFANRVGAVLCALPQQPELNRELIEDFLRNEYLRWITETVYRGIHRLPPAHTLIASRNGTEIREYYRFGSQPPPRYATDSQWIDAFRRLLDEAIRCRLRSNGPVGVLMGGLDSSSLACRAHAMLEAGADLPKVTLYSAVYDDTPGADEREYIAAVAAHCKGFEAKQIVSDALWALRPDEAGNGDLMDEPDIAAVRVHTLTLLRAPAKDGCRVVLGGEGANQVLGHGVYYMPSALTWCSAAPPPPGDSSTSSARAGRAGSHCCCVPTRVHFYRSVSTDACRPFEPGPNGHLPGSSVAAEAQVQFRLRRVGSFQTRHGSRPRLSSPTGHFEALMTWGATVG